MKISLKLNVLSVVTTVLLGTVTGITVVGLNSMEDYEAAAHRREEYVQAATEIKASSMATIMMDPSQAESKEIFTASERNIANKVAEATNVIKRPEVVAELSRILALWNHYDDESRKLMKLAETDVKGANEKLLPLYNSEFKPFQVALDNFIEARKSDSRDAIKKAKETAKATFWEIVSLLAVSSIVTISLVLTLSLSLRSAINGMLAQLKPLRDGDLTKRLPENGKDELGEIADGVNAFVTELQSIVIRTRDRSNRLAAAASQMKNGAERALSNASSQNDATASVAAAVEEFSVSIDQVADNAGQAEHKATLSGELSRSGGADVNGAVAGIKDIERAVGDASREMERLDERAKGIGSIVNVIKEVAEQTNLLALNAAIEAARAGETGRGFAVVADEVRKLAERTSNSAHEITEMVGAIQKNTETAGGVMKKGSGMVADGVRRAEMAGASMSKINDSSADVVLSIGDISSALREQRTAGAEIAKNVERIAQMTEEGRITAENVSSESKNLEILATELQTEVAKFRV